MSKDDFLGRWSKRKLGTDTEKPGAVEAVIEEVSEASLPDEEHVALLAEGEGDLVVRENNEDGEGEEHAPHPAEGIDIDELEYGSDFTPFMDAKVPKALKRMALRKLWRSNPILANVDGLNDYDEDFSDAAAVFINSAGKVISGAREQFWDDDQIAEGKDRIGEDTSEEEVDAEDSEQEVAEAEGSDNDEGDVEGAEDFGEPELAQNSDNGKLEEVDKKDAEKAEHDEKDNKA